MFCLLPWCGMASGIYNYVVGIFTIGFMLSWRCSSNIVSFGTCLSANYNREKDGNPNDTRAHENRRRRSGDCRLITKLRQQMHIINEKQREHSGGQEEYDTKQPHNETHKHTQLPKPITQSTTPHNNILNYVLIESYKKKLD